MKPQAKLAYVVTEDWYFWSHRLPSARAAQAMGYKVVLITRVHSFGERIRAADIDVFNWPVKRGSMNVWSEFRSFVALFLLLRAIRPDMVHNIALKPVIYGTIAATLSGVPAVVNSITGFGFLFASNKIIASLTGRVMLVALRRLARMRRVLTICQKKDDADLIFPTGASESQLRIIKGSGVDIGKFSPSPEPDGPPVAAFVGRMLWEKGVGELVAAAALLVKRGAIVRIVLVGPIDDQNPGAISEETVVGWQREGLVEWRGSQDDIVEVWRRSHIAVLPSYREGLPKALLEAAACGRPVITTDVPGCREVVEHERTGLLVPARDADAIADALQRLASSAELRVAIGAAGRRKVAAEFSDATVIEQISSAYRDAQGPQTQQ
jgi:glycosyltransferase involved in cell wall biosynthesis